jgi:hypothetical protein
MTDIEQPTKATDHAVDPAPDPADSTRRAYHEPVLRSHGGLRDVTSQMSGNPLCVVSSDVAVKQNVFAVVWA